MKANKIRLLFICHGNICRSPMAEYIFKHLCRERGVAELFEVASAAVSTEETGNDIYPPAKRKLREKGIPFEHHAAHQITRAEYDYYDGSGVSRQSIAHDAVDRRSADKW